MGFKVLFIYPNMMLMNMMPMSVSLFAAILREKGIEVKLFDTTYYRTEQQSSDEHKIEHLQVKPFNLAERGIDILTSDPYEDLGELVHDYRPDLIAMSSVEDTFPLGLSLLKSIRDYEAPKIVGGIFATFAPEKVIAEDCVDMICQGEGEEALLELCQRMIRNEDYSDIPNLWVKLNGTIIQNPMRKPVDLDGLPYPDFSIFEEKRLFRPMAGRVYRMIPIETHRGCPYTCTFCNSPASAELYTQGTGQRFLRKKSTKRMFGEIRHLVERWRPAYLYFTADTFLAMSDEELKELARLYKQIGLPFWIQSRPETFTEERVQILEEMGCHRLSIGIEHGNEEFRQKFLKRKVSNREIVQAFRWLEKSNIQITVNNIIGFPEETRELIFDTIRLNRQLKTDSVNAYVFVPYHGTPLHKLCLEKGYISKYTHTAAPTKDTVLDMPQLSKQEIQGLLRTFCLYVKMPESEFSRIRIAERFDEEGNQMFRELSEIYYEKFF